MRKIFKFIIKFNKAIIIAVILGCVVMGYFSTKLNIDASAETLLLENDPDLAKWREIAKRYVSPNFLVIAYTPKDEILSTASLELIKNLSDELAKNDMVQGVLSILNVPLLQSVEGGISGVLKHMPTLNDADINITKAQNEFRTSPLYSGNLVSKDLKTTAIVLNLKDDERYNTLLNERNTLSQMEKNGTLSATDLDKFESIKAEFKRYRDEIRIKEHNNLEQIKATIAKFNGDKTLFLGGVNMIADDMISFVRSDLYIYGISVFLLLAFSLWLFFRQIRWIVLPLFICAVSAVFTTGIFGYFGWEVTVISSNYIALQLIITISTTIHLIVSYREFFIKHPLYSQMQLVYLTLRDKASPSFWAIATTIIGFSSLITADIKPVIMLGVMMSSGIAVSLVIVFLLFGAIVVNLNKLSPTRTFEDSFKFTKHCANIAIHSRKTVYIVCILVITFGLYGISKLKVENSFIGYFKSDTQIRQGMQVIDTKLGGTIPVDVIITFKDNVQNNKNTESNIETDEFENEFSSTANDVKYWFNSYHTRVAEKIHDHLMQQNFVGNVSSLGTLIKVIRELNGGEVDDFLLAAMYSELPKRYKDILLSPFVSVEDNQLRFSIRVVDSDENLRRGVFLQNLKDSVTHLVKDDGVSVEVSGTMVLYNNMLQNLLDSQVDTFALTILVLFAVFCFIFRSVKLALIAIISNVIPLCTLFGVMGAFGIPLDVMSITIAAISIGIGVDDIIHYIHRFREEIHTRGIIESIRISHSSIGYAMYYTSFTIFLGFSVMTTSNFIPTIYFGLLTDLVMVFMLLGALIILPSLTISFVRKNGI
ncbi:RND family transporter [Campylobacter sp. faydin G-105]|uniref:efflux RND transporter permease subunit n=1 Tax=Campylobacter anatolicus TaxID=2829105 RepID=UPI001B97E68D|nr:MMPL family transporter [Campylobacter anatolicus]MBR8462267.1 RND family transporter [Campylobacter anatolicus]